MIIAAATSPTSWVTSSPHEALQVLRRLYAGTAHAPEGGASAGGKSFAGGQFVPNDASGSGGGGDDPKARVRAEAERRRQAILGRARETGERARQSAREAFERTLGPASEPRSNPVPDENSGDDEGPGDEEPGGEEETEDQSRERVRAYESRKQDVVKELNIDRYRDLGQRPKSPKVIPKEYLKAKNRVHESLVKHQKPDPADLDLVIKGESYIVSRDVKDQQNQPEFGNGYLVLIGTDHIGHAYDFDFKPEWQRNPQKWTILRAFDTAGKEIPVPDVHPVDRMKNMAGLDSTRKQYASLRSPRGALQALLRRVSYGRSQALTTGPSGRLASSRSKTGDPKCSAAASQLALRKATSESQKQMAVCRAMSKGQRAAVLQRAAGHEAKAQHLEHRAKGGVTGGPVTAAARKAAAVAKRTSRHAEIMDPNSDRNNRETEANFARAKARTQAKRAKTIRKKKEADAGYEQYLNESGEAKAKRMQSAPVHHHDSSVDRAAKLAHASQLDAEADRAYEHKEDARKAKEVRTHGRELTVPERLVRARAASGVHAQRSAGGDYEGKRVAQTPASEKLTEARKRLAERVKRNAGRGGDPTGPAATVTQETKPVRERTPKEQIERLSRVIEKTQTHHNAIVHRLTRQGNTELIRPAVSLRDRQFTAQHKRINVRIGEEAAKLMAQQAASTPIATPKMKITDFATEDEARKALPVGTPISLTYHGSEPSHYVVTGYKVNNVGNKSWGYDKTYHSAKLKYVGGGFNYKGIKDTSSLDFAVGDSSSTKYEVGTAPAKKERVTKTKPATPVTQEQAAGPMAKSSLFEQAAAHRAGKGKRESRIETLKEKARDSIGKRSGVEKLIEGKRGPVQASSRARDHLIRLTKATMGEDKPEAAPLAPEHKAALRSIIGRAQARQQHAMAKAVNRENREEDRFDQNRRGVEVPARKTHFSNAAEIRKIRARFHALPETKAKIAEQTERAEVKHHRRFPLFGNQTPDERPYEPAPVWDFHEEAAKHIKLGPRGWEDHADFAPSIYDTHQEAVDASVRVRKREAEAEIKSKAEAKAKQAADDARSRGRQGVGLGSKAAGRYQQAAREAADSAGFKKGTVHIQDTSGEEKSGTKFEIPAHIKGDIAVHKLESTFEPKYALTHVTSGLRIGETHSMRRAKEIASAIHQRKINLNQFSEPKGKYTSEAKKQIRYIRSLLSDTREMTGGYAHYSQSPRHLFRLITTSDGRVRLQYARTTGNKAAVTASPEACSGAASTWRLKKATPQTYLQLAACRAAKRGSKQAEMQRNAGQEGRAQHLEHRAKSGQAMTATARKAEAKRIKKLTPEERQVERAKAAGAKDRPEREKSRAAKGAATVPLSSGSSEAEPVEQQTEQPKKGNTLAFRPGDRSNKLRFKFESILNRQEWSPKDVETVKKLVASKTTPEHFRQKLQDRLNSHESGQPPLAAPAAPPPSGSPPVSAADSTPATAKHVVTQEAAGGDGSAAQTASAPAPRGRKDVLRDLRAAEREAGGMGPGNARWEAVQQRIKDLNREHRALMRGDVVPAPKPAASAPAPEPAPTTPPVRKIKLRREPVTVEGTKAKVAIRSALEAREAMNAAHREYGHGSPQLKQAETDFNAKRHAAGRAMKAAGIPVVRQPRLSFGGSGLPETGEGLRGDAAGAMAKESPSLQAQAAAHRAGKGDRATRVGTIGARVETAEKARSGGKHGGGISNHDPFARRNTIAQEHFAARKAAKVAKADAKVEAGRKAREATDPMYAKRRAADQRMDAQTAREAAHRAEAAKIRTPEVERKTLDVSRKAHSVDQLKRIRELIKNRGGHGYSTLAEGRPILGNVARVRAKMNANRGEAPAPAPAPPSVKPKPAPRIPAPPKRDLPERAAAEINTFGQRPEVVAHAIASREVAKAKMMHKASEAALGADHPATKAAAERIDKAKQRYTETETALDADNARRATGPATPAEPFNLKTFADRVQAAGRTSPTGWFGDNKVFISHLWQSVKDDPTMQGMNFDTFKQHLAEANQARHLDLSRADLVESMDPEDVKSSHTQHYGSDYHFIKFPESTFENPVKPPGAKAANSPVPTWWKSSGAPDKAAAARQARLGRAGGVTPEDRAQIETDRRNDLDRARKRLADRRAAPKTVGAPVPKTSAASHEKQVEDTYYRLSGGESNKRVRLADIREALPHIPQEHLDNALMNMAASGAASLYQLDNPREIGDRDRKAVLHTPSGNPRHILYLGGRGS